MDIRTALTCGTCGDNWGRYNHCSWADALRWCNTGTTVHELLFSPGDYSATGDKRRGESTYRVSLVGEGTLATSSSFCADVFLQKTVIWKYWIHKKVHTFLLFLQPSQLPFHSLPFHPLPFHPLLSPSPLSLPFPFHHPL